MPIQRDHAAEREVRIDAFLLAVRRSADLATDTTERAQVPLPLNAAPSVTVGARLTK